MKPRIDIAPDVLAEARRLYEQTNVPLLDIAELMKVSRTTLHHRIHHFGWRGRKARPDFSVVQAVSEAVSPPASVADEPAAAAPFVMLDAEAAAQQRTVIAQRLMVVAEREMDAIERIVAVLKPADQRDAQHSARTLASVSRILHDIKLLTQPATEAPSDDPDPVPRDVDEFRRVLARRIRGFIQAQSGEGCGVSDEPEAELG